MANPIPQTLLFLDSACILLSALRGTYQLMRFSFGGGGRGNWACTVSPVALTSNTRDRRGSENHDLKDVKHESCSKEAPWHAGIAKGLSYFA